MIRGAVVPHEAPKGVSIKAVKSFLILEKIDVEGRVPFNELLNEYPDGGYLS